MLARLPKRDLVDFGFSVSGLTIADADPGGDADKCPGNAEVSGRKALVGVGGGTAAAEMPNSDNRACRWLSCGVSLRSGGRFTGKAWVCDEAESGACFVEVAWDSSGDGCSFIANIDAFCSFAGRRRI